jgi:hypothetical protein
MTRSRTHSNAAAPRLRPVPLLVHESLYVGIDVGKHQHVAGFVSRTLLERHGRFEGCPALTFANTGEGFRTLIERLETYTPHQDAGS